MPDDQSIFRTHGTIHLKTRLIFKGLNHLLGYMPLSVNLVAKLSIVIKYLT